MTYLHELSDWPNFSFRVDALANQLAEVRHKEGWLLGRMSVLDHPPRTEAGIEALTLELVKSSAIEGETVDAGQARSSLARQLGLSIGELKPASRAVDSLVEMTLDATQRYAEPLSKKRLCGWRAALFPSGQSGGRKITVGDWRDGSLGPMRVVSGPYGHEKIHFEAPDAERLPAEMEKFLTWFNKAPTYSTSRQPDLEPVLKAGIAHLWFVTIHPFEDGNGRIGRAITDCALARADQSPNRFYSLSAQIERERKAYYAILEESHRGGLDIPPWLVWFLGCLGRAIESAEKTLSSVWRKERVWRQASQYPLNERQRLVLTRLLGDFVGQLNAGKYAKLAKCSPDTALRDLRELIEYGLIKRGEKGGRSSSYELTISLADTFCK
ncbi:MAG: Fic family protein [Deltaproteobacteria bacterium]|jgi:Fic family protein|nr:Fic family protein [Deltaproteobacteria bacterium]